MDGIIIINKEKGYTSNDVVQIVKHIFNKKVGHTGTLDPNATGVLPLLIGKATKISKYLINHDKIYDATIQLGYKTDTADAEGKIIEEKKVKKELLTNKNIKKILSEFVGESEQIPPMYSAIKINGKKLYEYARQGQEINVQKRKVKIYNIELNSIDIEKSRIEFRAECSKGTYIRTLCEDIAKKIETVGYMKELNRIQVCNFNIKDAINIDELKKNKGNEKYLTEHIINVEKVVDNFEIITLKNNEIERLLNGVRIEKKLKNGIYRIYNESNVFIGTGIVKDYKLKRDVIF